MSGWICERCGSLVEGDLCRRCGASRPANLTPGSPQPGSYYSIVGIRNLDGFKAYGWVLALLSIPLFLSLAFIGGWAFSAVMLVGMAVILTAKWRGYTFARLYRWLRWRR